MATPGVYGIDIADLKYALQTADTGTSGPTWSALVDMPAAAEMSVTFEQGDERTLEGDGGIVQTNTAKGVVRGTLRLGGITPQIVADLFGHVLVQSGTTPNIKNTLTYKDAVSRPFFKVEGRALNNEQGDTHVLVYKAQVDKVFPDVALTQGDWTALEIPIICYLTTSTKVVNAVAQNMLIEIIQNETAAAIA